MVGTRSKCVTAAEAKKGPLIPTWANQGGCKEVVALDLEPTGQVVRRQRGGPAQALASESPKFKSYTASVQPRGLRPGLWSLLHSSFLCKQGAM